jgi:hypothetical protein
MRLAKTATASIAVQFEHLTPLLWCHFGILHATGLKALIYSGDHDLCVPHTGSEAWTAALHKSDSQECQLDSDDDNTLAKCDGVTTPWQPWYNSEVPEQVCRPGCHVVCEARKQVCIVVWLLLSGPRSSLQDHVAARSLGLSWLWHTHACCALHHRVVCMWITGLVGGCFHCTLV